MATALPKKVWGKKSEVKGVLIRFDCWQKNKARFVFCLKKKKNQAFVFVFLISNKKNQI